MEGCHFGAGEVFANPSGIAETETKTAPVLEASFVASRIVAHTICKFQMLLPLSSDAEDHANASGGSHCQNTPEGHACGPLENVGPTSGCAKSSENC